jgi:hypothetical protein
VDDVRSRVPARDVRAGTVAAARRSMSVERGSRQRRPRRFVCHAGGSLPSCWYGGRLGAAVLVAPRARAPA